MNLNYELLLHDQGIKAYWIERHVSLNMETVWMEGKGKVVPVLN
jgi:hypothetical protein